MAVAQKRKKRPRKKTAKRFRFQLSLGGVVGVGVVTFFLFFWMFLFGIWAGQTILLPPEQPSRHDGKAPRINNEQRPVVQVIRPRNVKRK